MNYSRFYDLIDPGIRCRRLVVRHEHRDCIVRTMAALQPDVKAAVIAAVRLVEFYGEPWQPRDQRIR